MEKPRELITSNFEKVKKAFEPLIVQGAILPLLEKNKEYTDDDFALYGILLSRFECAVEIAFNIFFRIVEMTEYGNISGEERECIANIHRLGLISNPDIWLDIIGAQQSLLTYCPPSRKIQICNDIISTYKNEMKYLLQKGAEYI